MYKKEVVVVIPHFNGFQHLSVCLDALRKQSYSGFEVIIADDGSTDGSADYLKEHYPWVKVLSLGSNKGFARAVNSGIGKALGDKEAKYIVLLNNDTYPEYDWLEELVKAMESDFSAGFAASKVLFMKDRHIINSAGDKLSKAGFASNCGAWEQDGVKFSQLGYVFGASAAAAIYRRKMFEDVGLFDEDFFAYCEDVDLSFRAQIKGYKCLYVPSARVYHHGSLTGKNIADYYNARNTFFVLIKNMPARLIRKYLLHLFYAHFIYIYEKRRIFLTVLRAYLAAFIQAGRMLKKRKAIQRGMKVSVDYIDSLLA
jgi:GT2 family glycosyltransferase